MPHKLFMKRTISHMNNRRYQLAASTTRMSTFYSYIISCLPIFALDVSTACSTKIFILQIIVAFLRALDASLCAVLCFLTKKKNA